MGSKPVRHLALLRGVNNIGKSKRVAMADLRALFETLGFEDVRTLLNSGNVVFSARGRKRREIRERIQTELHLRLKLSAQVILLSANEVAAVVLDNPLAGIATNPSHLLVVVPHTRPDLAQLRPFLKQRWAPEVLAVGSRVAYVWCANGVPRSPLRLAVDRALNRSGTVRNIATFTKAMALIQSPSTMPNQRRT